MLHIQPSKLKGSLKVPPSKSQTMRALTFAFLAKGISHIQDFLNGPDTHAMIQAIRTLGGVVDVGESVIAVDGICGKIRSVEDVIHCGNSGQILRFMGAISALSSQYTVLTGDHSIRHSRLCKPLLDGLTQLGAFAVSTKGDGYAPIIVKGPITKNQATIVGADSQPVSGLLMASAFAPHEVELFVKNPGEKPWIEMTLHWMRKLYIPFANENYQRYALKGNAKPECFDYVVPGDFSSASFPIGAALITGSEITLKNLDFEDPQGDKEIISILRQMGAHFQMREGAFTVAPSSLKGMTIDCNNFIDALPILAVIGCFAEGKTKLINAEIARHKESDRIQAIVTELKKMGANIEEKPDGLVVEKSTLKGANLAAHKDHRIALALSVAALGAEGESSLDGAGVIEKSYPTFFKDFISIGAKLKRPHA